MHFFYLFEEGRFYLPGGFASRVFERIRFYWLSCASASFLELEERYNLIVELEC
jgi:hypothetical protein